MEPKIDQKLTLAQVGVPEGPRGRFWKDFGPMLELFWDDFSKVFGRISMLGLIVFKVCCFFVLGEVVGDIAVLLPPSWI